jgi:crotonobetainyl-CoA:carnitine CoA-transferase CaiB-like acyl-CoA transferase
VIKIERAEGETARHYDRAVEGVSAYFAWLNRGKESAVLDLKDAADLDLVRRLVARADVFVQNLAPGATARLGLGAADLVARHPRLVAVDIVGYGQETDYRDKRAYDLLVQAESGLCAVTGSPGEAAKVGVSAADIATGMNAHAAILEALLGRERTGRGRAIEIAMFDGLADWMTVPLLHWEHQGRETARHGLSHAAIQPYGPVACRDGAVIVVVQNPTEWRRFCEGVLRRPELVADPRFAENPARVRNREALDREMAPVFAALDRAEAVARLEASQLAWGRVSGVADLAAHPALRRASATLPDGASFALPRPAGRAALPASAVPALGAHTDRIRTEFHP